MSKPSVAVVLLAGVAFACRAIAQQDTAPLRIPPSPLLTIDQHRQSVVDGIVGTWRDVLAMRHGATLAAAEAKVRDSLMGLRSDKLLAASLAGSYATVEALLAETQNEVSSAQRVVLKGLGSASADLTYTPVNPCRILDTRVAGGSLAANVSRNFDAYNAASFAFQGGAASSCGMPSGAAAVAMNVYAVNPTNLGFIKLWPANGSEPPVSTVNYQVGITAIATGTIVPVDGSNSNRFVAKSPAVVHFVADVVGYFKAPGDATGLDILANGTRVMRYEYNATSPNLIGGHPTNKVTGGAWGAKVVGGGASGTQVVVPSATWNCSYPAGSSCANEATAPFATISGGVGNLAFALGGSADFATIAGGRANTAAFSATAGGGAANTASGNYGTIAGGYVNTASGITSTVAGGTLNTASSLQATVGGGANNTASGNASTVAGGSNNVASGDNSIVAGGHSNTASGSGSFAAGSNAQATADGCFVWADASIVDPIGCFANTFVVRAFAGVAMATGGSNPNYSGARLAAGSGSWSSFSDRNGKQDVESADPAAVLAKVAALPIATWSWKSQPSAVRHMGPMAQDFHAAFGLGEDDTHISAVDIEGVALAAIQGLNGKLQAEVAEKDRAIAELRYRMTRLESLRDELMAMKATLAAIHGRRADGN